MHKIAITAYGFAELDVESAILNPFSRNPDSSTYFPASNSSIASPIFFPMRLNQIALP